MALGFHQVCKYYYWPGVHKQGAIQQMLVSKAKFDALPDSLKRVITVAAQASHQDMTAEYNWLNANALNTLKSKHGVEARKLPEPYREFTNQAGKTIHAKPVTVTAGKVTIERKDGKVFTLPLTSLSEADQEFLKEWAGRQ